MKNIEVSHTGLKCDNSECDWKDESVGIDDYEQWLNRPCPKCGQNLLTEEDHENAKATLAWVEMINALSPEELEQMAASLKEQRFTGSQLFECIPGAEFLDEAKGPVTMVVDTHEQVKIVEFKTDQQP